MMASNDDLMDSNEKLSNAVKKIEDQKNEIKELIYIDSLTKLKNRRAINELVHRWLEETKGDVAYSILFLDVDNFKLINDSFGHDFGDKVIIRTGMRLVSLETESIKIGRFGGDEFLIIYKDKDMNQFSEFLNALEQIFKNPFVIDNRTIFLTVSIGAAIYPIHGVGEEELIKKADMALYKAKERGKNRAVIYNQKMIEEVEDKVLFQSHLRGDFARGEFYLNYQPVFDVKKNTFMGAEALIRWKNTEFGQVSPIRLIQAAEEMGLIIKIGKWVLREACIFAKKINEQTKEDFIVAINISSVQMMDPDFAKDFSEIIKEVGVNPKLICLEMTETMLFEFPEDNVHMIDRLKAMGVCIALDDFGTGYSSLSYFKNIPASTLKIDKEFIDNLATNLFDCYMVETIIRLAHHKNLVVVAEGVENQEQLKILQDLKCDLIQGYYYSKPISEFEVTELILK
jgi:diguanylate cyclase (GGDEF)-like protein